MKSNTQQSRYCPLPQLSSRTSRCRVSMGYLGKKGELSSKFAPYIQTTHGSIGESGRDTSSLRDLSLGVSSVPRSESTKSLECSIHAPPVDDDDAARCTCPSSTEPFSLSPAASDLGGDARSTAVTSLSCSLRTPLLCVSALISCTPVLTVPLLERGSSCRSTSDSLHVAGCAALPSFIRPLRSTMRAVA